MRAVGGYTYVFVERTTKRPAGSGMPEKTWMGLEKLLIDEKSKM